MTFNVFILGSSSATPAFNRHPSAQLVNHNDHYFLIDCGESTQIRLSHYKLKYHRINHIFISHLHGDHYLGIVGLLSTLHLQGRTTPLHLYAPPELLEILNLQFTVSETTLRYELIFHATHNHNTQVLYEDDTLTVSTIILNHRIPTTGFLFKEKKHPRRILKEKLEQYAIPIWAIENLKQGQDYKSESGTLIPNNELTEAPLPVRSYAYCSDTSYYEPIIPIIEGVNLLYHEATFKDDLAERAKETYHTTSKQAGIIAKKAGVKQLLLGHFSARYADLQPLLAEALQHFPNSQLAEEGKKFDISFE